MANTTSQLKPLLADLIPPRGAVRAGTMPDGRQLYKFDPPRKRSRAVPKHVKDPKTGRVVHDDFGNPVREMLRNKNGDPYQPANENEFYYDDWLFFLEQLPNKSIQMVRYTPPTPEQIAAIERQKKIDAMGGGALGAALVDAGITDPAELVRQLRRDALDAPVLEPPAADDDPPDVSFPIDSGDGHWILSDGSDFEGTPEEAKAAEAEVPPQEEVVAY